MDLTTYQVVSLLLSVVTVLVAVGAFHRAGRWRESDGAKAITAAIAELQSNTASDDGGTIKADIHKIRNEITKIEVRLGGAERASDKVSTIEGRITGIETSLQHMASRSDIESVKSEIAGVEQLGRSTSAAVTRIESFLMERAGS